MSPQEKIQRLIDDEVSKQGGLRGEAHLLAHAHSRIREKALRDALRCFAKDPEPRP